MVAAVSVRTPLPSVATGGGSERAPDLEAKLNTTRAQLEDWVTCPSAKTPEGKAKVEQLTAKFLAIQQQIAVKAEQRSEGEGARAGRVAAAAASTPRAPAFDSPLGQRLDVYA